jgi:hypothetical protein
MLNRLAGLDPTKTDRLLQYILVAAADEDDWRDRELGSIHILKYTYLGDLAFAAKHSGDAYTGAEWEFYHFGPWVAQVHDRIEPALIAIGAAKRTIPSNYDNDFVRFSIAHSDEFPRLRERLENELPLGVGIAVRSAVHEFGANTTALLRHVYLTPPMVTAAPGEKLDLAIVSGLRRESAGTEIAATDKMTTAQRRRRKEILSDLRKRIREGQAAASSPEAAVSPAPRYDAVFAAGTEWLDIMAGEPVTEMTGELTIASDVWKSPTRTEPDVP